MTLTVVAVLLNTRRAGNSAIEIPMSIDLDHIDVFMFSVARSKMSTATYIRLHSAPMIYVSIA